MQQKNLRSTASLLFELSKTDFQKKYLGSYLGVIWAFIQPAITILIFWFVFQVGFKSVPINNVPYILWLTVGLVPWFFFSDSLNATTGAILENDFLVKKVVFKVELLPLVKIISSLYVHLFFIFIVFLLFFLYGYSFSFYNLQFLYYLFSMTVLVTGAGWLFSALSVFLKDTGPLISMVVQFGFWLTPIFWDMKQIPDNFKSILMLNPMYYIVQGYRDTFINHVWFWEKPFLSSWFWFVTLLFLFLGKKIFKKLKPHFADVL
ncbi:ABC transporter permease [Paenibacillus silagei]|uniref:Transport permease protein n=1 Tax=Paenibacillus silagei TaxID=1670801 RepID=A0ABS4NIL2_9BACL|nr:ABC transporter permease [Paenibacillus silagei]MBP2109889.1 lipopolysaccharide transport system permease protein/teichoic acid transport system permease protein [Paenibacillus silagei]